MRIYPAVHYTMGGLWVDYNLMSNVPGLFVLGEANFSDHGANRLGASALMQGLADGYFVLPYTIGDYLRRHGRADRRRSRPTTPRCKQAEAEVSDRLKRLLAVKGKRSVLSFHRELGKVMWDDVRHGADGGQPEAGAGEDPALREEFWQNVSVPGGGDELNQALEQAGRVADFLEFGELLCRDALDRDESCGGHFREEYQTPDGEAQRDDEHFCYVAAWEYEGAGKPPVCTRSRSCSRTSSSSVRSYK